MNPTPALGDEMVDRHETRQSGSDRSGHAEHTPGPWIMPHFARDDHSCDCQYVLSEHHMGAVATVQHDREIGELSEHNPPFAEAQANARLIAAAPELLEAVQRAKRHAMNIGVDNGSYYEQLCAAIAKATGLGARPQGSNDGLKTNEKPL